VLVSQLGIAEGNAEDCATKLMSYSEDLWCYRRIRSYLGRWKRRHTWWYIWDTYFLCRECCFHR
jgi:hypothetical protein